MTNEQNIPGVPEGWRLVGFKVGVSFPEWILNSHGRPEQWPISSCPSQGMCAVIERIPKPKKKVLVEHREHEIGPTQTYNKSWAEGLCRLYPDQYRIEERDA